MACRSLKTSYAVDLKPFGLTSPAFPLLEKGYEVTVNEDGWVVDARDSRTNKLYATDGSEIGSRSTPFRRDDEQEVKVLSRKNYVPEQKGLFPEGSDIWEALNAGRTVTLDERGVIVEIRDPATGKTYDLLGKETGLILPSGYIESYKKSVKNPRRATYKPKDMGIFEEGTDMWQALAISPDMEVTLDDRGSMMDIWDSKTGTLYNRFGYVIGTRINPYPSDNNLGELKARSRVLTQGINVSKRTWYKERGRARVAAFKKLQALQRELRLKLYLYGKLQTRRRSMDEAYQRKITKGR